MRYNSNVLKIKTSWYLKRKTKFKLLIKNQLGPARRAEIFKMFGYLFWVFGYFPKAMIISWQQLSQGSNKKFNVLSQKCPEKILAKLVGRRKKCFE